jgi:hypothetical protein
MFWYFFYYFCLHLLVGSWLIFEAIFKSRYPLTWEELKEQPVEWFNFFCGFIILWPYFVYLGFRSWIRGE